MRPRAGMVALLAVLAACGSAAPPEPRPPPARETPVPREPTAEEVATIRGWADALRAGRVAAAARFFALPALVSNPAPVLRLRDRAAVESFNAGLPCGAELVGAERGSGPLVIATFRLTERPGPGRCGSGTGAFARTAFLVRDGRIVQWLRVADPPEPEGQAS